MWGTSEKKADGMMDTNAIKVMLRSAAYTAYRRLTEENEPDLYAIASILESVAVDAKLEIPVATIKQPEFKAVPADMNVSALKAQAQDAMRSKPQPKSLIRETNDSGDGGGESGVAEGPAPATEGPAAGPTSETLFQPYYSTSHGRMYLGDAYDVLRQLIAQGVRVKLLFTSPPFALIRKKSYGNENQEQYVAWFMKFAPLFHQILEPDGSFVMDIGGSWLPGIPARSVYQYKLLLKLCESNFYLAQEFYHYNPARLPSPAEWVTVRRLRVKDAMNNVWWFVKDPFADASNSRVLNEYSAAMKNLLKNGYKAKMRPSGHDVSKNFSNDRGGAIPSNLLQFANTDSNGQYLRQCRESKIAPHPARFPAGLPSFFIRFLTKPGELVLDPFAGSNVTGHTAESLDRRWMGIEISEDYIKGSKFRFDKPSSAKPVVVRPEKREQRLSRDMLFSSNGYAIA